MLRVIPEDDIVSGLPFWFRFLRLLLRGNLHFWLCDLNIRIGQISPPYDTWSAAAWKVYWYQSKQAADSQEHPESRFSVQLGIFATSRNIVTA